MNAPILEVNDLSLSFGNLQVASDITFDLFAGDRTAIIGPNGAGKTTLINMLVGTQKPNSGKVLLNGVEQKRLKPYERARSGLCRTYQISNLYPTMTVFESIFMPVAERIGISTSMFRSARAQDSAIAEVEHILHNVALSDHADRVVSVLPYGLRRLVELGITLALQPKVLLLDEPTAGIPNREAALVHRVLANLPIDIAILLVEHDMDFVFDFAERVIVLVEGTILRIDSPEGIANDTAVRQIYLGEAHG